MSFNLHELNHNKASLEKPKRDFTVAVLAKISPLFETNLVYSTLLTPNSKPKLDEVRSRLLV